MSRRRLAALSLSLSAALVLAACGSSSTEEPAASSGDSAGSDFPVTIKHGLGTTTIEKKPTRVATVGWGNQEVPLALGVVPVGMPKVTWGDDDDDGVLPWVEEKITELGGKTPALYDETDGIDFEGVAATKPDVILAAYSGLTAQEYETLSKIAPVVAYPDKAWTTSMDDMIRLDSKGLGLEEEGEALVADLDKQVTDTAAKYPNLKGTKVMWLTLDPTDLSKITYYTGSDPRAVLLNKAGMQTPKAVADAGTEAFYKTISSEQGDTLSDAQMAVAYSSDPTSLMATAAKDPLWSKLPPVQKQTMAFLPDDTPQAAVANPSPLGIPWGLDGYFKTLDDVAAKAR